MTGPCDRAQETLAGGGVDALSVALREHVAGCEACSGVLLALFALDEELMAWPGPARPEGLDARVGQAVAAEVAAAEPELELDPEPDDMSEGAVDSAAPPESRADPDRVAPPEDRADPDQLSGDPIDSLLDLDGSCYGEPRRWWRRPILLMVGSAAALMLLASTSLLMVQSGGKIKGLFETADSEIDSVDSNLGSSMPGRFVRLVLPESASPSRPAPAADAAAYDEDFGAGDLVADLLGAGDTSGLRGEGAEGEGLGAPGLRGGGGGDGAAGLDFGGASGGKGGSAGRRGSDRAKVGRLDRDSDEWRAMDPDGDGIRRPAGGSDGKNMSDVFKPNTRQRIQRKRDRPSDITITSPRRSGRSARRARQPSPEPTPSVAPRVDEAIPQSPRGSSSGSSSSVVKKSEAPRPQPTPEPSMPEPAEIAMHEASMDSPPPPPEEKASISTAFRRSEGTALRERLDKEASSRGLLALIGTTGESAGQANADLLSDASSLSSDVGEALARSSGLWLSGGRGGPGGGYRGPDDGRAGDDLARFGWFEENAQLDVPTVAAAGYWSNTYVPGDPALRRLESRVRNGRGQRMGLGIDPKQLDVTVRQIRQPFDAPTDGALGVYLHADRRGITEPTRMRIQVGIQGTERRSGRRPAMNVGVVLDLRGSPSAGDAASMRALVEALVKARDLGDTFSLTVAGRPGGQIVPAPDFRYGPVRLAMESLFGDTPPEGETLGIQVALQRAIDSVGATDDPNRPLGSSVVLLVSPRRLAEDRQSLEFLAHRSAVAGIPVSVVGVGSGADMGRLESIALAGQGNRRVLSDSSGAEAVVDRELSAASRVVARAVRLRIRLAPGVRLVDVLGSEDLDAAQSQQVREAEQSIDRRLARNLGIQADRGDDEEGIQIVIPTWYAGDGHAILLDVIAPGPGAIADVSVKYKDLVRLNNGSARASLHLGRDPRPPGPLELNVLKNEIAHYLSGRLAEAADEVTRGKPVGGARVVRAASHWLQALQLAVPALYGDRELQRDHSLLAAYASALDVTNNSVSNQFLDDSLRLAARRKVLAPLAEDSEGAP